MAATLDVTAVRRFTEDFENRVRRCDNGEGMICSNLDESINHYVQLADELRAYVNQWAGAVFSGRLEFDPTAEKLVKEESQRFLHRAKQVAARGRAMDGACYVLQGLNSLHYHIADFDYLIENWVSPRLAVSPTPRLKRSHAVDQQVLERVGKLSALPTDWCPRDAEQQAFFQKQRTT